MFLKQFKDQIIDISVKVNMLSMHKDDKLVETASTEPTKVVEHCCNAAPTPFEGLLHNNDLL
jgi:hypothetical protein